MVTKSIVIVYIYIVSHLSFTFKINVLDNLSEIEMFQSTQLTDCAVYCRVIKFQLVTYPAV